MGIETACLRRAARDVARCVRAALARRRPIPCRTSGVIVHTVIAPEGGGERQVQHFKLRGDTRMYTVHPDYGLRYGERVVFRFHPGRDRVSGLYRPGSY